MTEQVIMYIIVIILAALIIFSFAIGVEKMIKIILGNYILSSICRAASISINMLISYLTQFPELKFAGLSYKTL
ncbi:MAG: hypothetical protein WCG98_05445 [bacterium]